MGLFIRLTLTFQIVEQYRVNIEVPLRILVFLHLRYFQEVGNHNHRLEYEHYIVEGLGLKILGSMKRSCLKLSRNHRLGLLGQ